MMDVECDPRAEPIVEPFQGAETVAIGVVVVGPEQIEEALFERASSCDGDLLAFWCGDDGQSALTSSGRLLCL
jgi:hypothetical protein